MNGIITLITVMTPINNKIKNNNKNTINCVGEVFALKLPNKCKINFKNLIFLKIIHFQLISI